MRCITAICAAGPPKLIRATRVHTRTASPSDTPCPACGTASLAATFAMFVPFGSFCGYFLRQCFMQMSYSVVQAARELFFTQARCASAHILQLFVPCAPAGPAAPKAASASAIAIARIAPLPPGGRNRPKAGLRRVGVGGAIRGCAAIAPYGTASLSSLRCGLVEGRAQAAGELERVVVGPEMHEEQARLLIEHVAVQRRHLDAVVA